jgi:hypothetical protein
MVNPEAVYEAPTVIVYGPTHSTFSSWGNLEKSNKFPTTVEHLVFSIGKPILTKGMMPDEYGWWGVNINKAVGYFLQPHTYTLWWRKDQFLRPQTGVKQVTVVLRKSVSSSLIDLLDYLAPRIAFEDIDVTVVCACHEDSAPHLAHNTEALRREAIAMAWLWRDQRTPGDHHSALYHDNFRTLEQRLPIATFAPTAERVRNIHLDEWRGEVDEDVFRLATEHIVELEPERRLRPTY